jgi:hypothetical protein
VSKPVAVVLVNRASELFPQVYQREKENGLPEHDGSFGFPTSVVICRRDVSCDLPS